MIVRSVKNNYLKKPVLFILQILSVLFIPAAILPAYDFTGDGKIEMSDAIFSLQKVSRSGEKGAVSLCHTLHILKLLADIPEPYILVWSDEFNGNELNREKWRIETGSWGSGNGELQYYRLENIKVADGYLWITAQKEPWLSKQFTSGRITSAGLFSVKYGKIEARIKVPLGVGLWPAFWMLGNSKFTNGWPHCGEIDIMETGKQEDILAGTYDRTVHATVHYSSYSSLLPGGHMLQTGLHRNDKPLSEDFHIFGMEWDDRHITFYFDDEAYFTVDLTTSKESLEEFHKCFFLIVNLAVGGAFTGIMPGEENQVNFDSPQSMVVDWIRIYQKRLCDACIPPTIPECPDFSIYKDIISINSDAMAIDVDAKLDIWNNLTPCEKPSAPDEGSNSLCFTAKSGQWAGFGIRSLYPRNLAAYADDLLRLMLKTESQEPFAIGMSSSNEPGVGDSWIFFKGPGKDPFGFVRDNQWHEVVISLADFKRTNFSQVVVPLMFSTCVLNSDMTIELDGAYISDIGTCKRPVPGSPMYKDYLIYSETLGFDERFKFDVEGALEVWKNLTIAENCTDSVEGLKSLKITTQTDDFYGMGIRHSIGKDMTRFSGGFLHVSIKTDSPNAFKIGIKSHVLGGKGESWVTINGTTDNPYGFSADGQWHELVIPVAHFRRTDLSDVTQLFMLAGDLPKSPVTIMIDNIYWSYASGSPPAPCNHYIVFSDETCGSDQFVFDREGSLNIWNNLTVETSASPDEGASAWKMTAQPGQWFGAGVVLNSPKNMMAHCDDALHFSLKTSSTHPFRIGVSSSTSEAQGDSWIYFIPGKDPAGFVRDGLWHDLTIPISEFQRTNISSVKQVFMIAGDAPLSEFIIEVDDVYWENNDPIDAPFPDQIVYQNDVVYSETTGGTDYFRIDQNGRIQVWEYSDLTVSEITDSKEGGKAYRFLSNNGKYFGAGIMRYTPRDMIAYQDGTLRFSMKSTAGVSFKIGIQSSGVNRWIEFPAGKDPYSFVRDGQWHDISIPLRDFGGSLANVSYVFMILANELNESSESFAIDIDDVYWSNGVTTITTDSDRDLMPDIWEKLIIDHNPNDAIQTVNDVLPLDDYDKDGVSNLKEYRRGTSPIGGQDQSHG